jgi:hypothetical protein
LEAVLFAPTVPQFHVSTAPLQVPVNATFVRSNDEVLTTEK